jgi:hypothetical protein
MDGSLHEGMRTDWGLVPALRLNASAKLGDYFALRKEAISRMIVTGKRCCCGTFWHRGDIPQDG